MSSTTTTTQVIPQQQQQQQAQPFVYPNTGVGEVEPQQTSHSHDSFASVFIVLAVIIVVSAIACFLGRFCSKSKKQKASGGGRNNSKQQKQKNKKGSKGRGEMDRDIEFGFDMKTLPGGRPTYVDHAKVHNTNFKIPPSDHYNHQQNGHPHVNFGNHVKFGETNYMYGEHDLSDLKGPSPI